MTAVVEPCLVLEVIRCRGARSGYIPLFWPNISAMVSQIELGRVKGTSLRLQRLGIFVWYDMSFLCDYGSREGNGGRALRRMNMYGDR